MHGLRWGMMVGVCGITWSILGGAQSAPLPGALKVDVAIQGMPLTKIDQSLEKVLAPIVTQTKTEESRAIQSPLAAPGTKELVPEGMTSTSEAPASQVPIAEAPSKRDQPAVQEEMQSIDTMDLEQPEGNWLNKRIWWERAKDKYKECREVFEAIFASRMGFLEKRSDVEKTIFGPFYREIGLEQAELRELLTAIIDKIEEERGETGSLDEKERAYLEKITAAKKDLEQLKLDVDAINNIDNAIDTAVNKLSNKINEAHRFEQSAWEEFDAIAHELSDKRAYERYFVIDGIHKNLKDLQKYITDEFTTYFNQLVQAAQDKTERAKKEAKALKDQDIDLEEQAKLLVADEQAEEDEEAKRAAQKVAEEAKKAAEAAKVGFLGNIWSYFVGMLKSLWNLLFGWWLYRM